MGSQYVRIVIAVPEALASKLEETSERLGLPVEDVHQRAMWCGAMRLRQRAYRNRLMNARRVGERVDVWA